MTDQNQEQNSEIPFGIVIQYIKDQSFENPNPVEAFLATAQEQPNISVDISAKANKVRDNFYEVILDIRAEAKTQDKTLFIAELSYGAIAGIGDEIPQEALGPVLMVHFPTLLFPFARSIIATMTREGGFPALMLSPVDFAALYEENQQNKKSH